MRPRAKKRYGQHFLEPAWADKLVEAIAPAVDDRFVEIGPGPGVLTLRLASRVARLTAIEVDRDLVASLAPRVPPNVTLIEADFLEFDLGSLADDRPFRVVGNLPYNVSSPILFKILQAHRTRRGILDATLMLQREVADRLTASAGTADYGVLSILIQMHADVRRVLALPPGAFRPAPKVRSAVVSLRFRSPSVTVTDERGLEAMVRMMFMQRRKTLVNALSAYAAFRRVEPRRALEAAGIDPRRRPETLQLTELARLADYFTSAG